MTGKTLREQLAPLLKPGAVGQCVSKYRYQSEREAVGAATGRLKSTLNPPVELTVYRCQTCNGWHLSKMPRG